MDSIFFLDPKTRVRGAVDRRGQVLRQIRRVVDPDTGNVALVPRATSWSTPLASSTARWQIACREI